MNYTYKIPNSEKTRKALIAIFESWPSDWSDGAFLILSNCKIELEGTTEPYDKDGHFRLDITIRTTIETYETFDNILELENVAGAIIERLNEVLPSNCGYKVKYLNIVPNVEEEENETKDIILKSLKTERLNILGKDLIEKGKRMSNAYIILFCLENLIRSFIDRVLSQKVGPDYESKNTISNKILKKAIGRKKEEDERHWIPMRGDKILYYLDFIELGDVILFNKKYFEGLIPTEDWIRGKFEELKEIRNRVAHNTYIDDDTFKALEVYYSQLVKQMGESVRSK